MAKSFTVPCPSCEADVLVKNEGMIGKKIDCPKCKYRFKVPDPNAAEAGDDVPADEAAPPKKKKKGNPKVLIGAGVGVAAVVLLGVVGFFMFAGDDKPQPKPVAQQPRPQPQPQPQPQPETQNNNTDPMPMPMGDPMPMGNGNDPMNPVIAPPMSDIAKPNVIPGQNANPMVPKAEILAPVAAGQMKDGTNLLPGKAQAVLTLNMQRLQNTPIYSTFFDRQTLDFFRSSMSFDATDITHLYLALVGADREPFAIIRTKAPVPSLSTMAERMKVETGKLSPIKNRQYAVIQANPFLTAISRALSTESLLGSAGIPITDEDKKRWAEKPMAICVYDSQTVLIGEVSWMEGYLEDLGENGYPPFQTELTPAAAPPVAPPAGGEGAPMGGLTPATPMPMGGATPMPATPMPMGSRSGPPPGMGTTPIPMGPPPGAPVGPGGGGGAAAAPAKPAPKLYTSVPTYRTVKPELKRMLNLLEEDDKNPPAVVYADILDKRLFSRDYQSLYASIGLIVGMIVEHTQMMGLSITQFQKEKLTAQVVFEFVSAEDAKVTANERLDEILKLLAAVLSHPLGTPIEVKNTAAGNQTGSPGGEGAGPMGLTPAGVEGGGSRGGPPPGMRAAGPMGPMGNGPQLGPDGQPVRRPGETPSKVELAVRDTLLTVDAEINWNADAYAKLVQPGVANATTQLKGRMSVLSGATKQHDLAGPLKKLMDEKKMAPPGTFARNANIDRYGLPYPPDHRVSFMADLLPYLGKGGLRQSIDEKKFPWYAKENEAAATTWVSEFLVPYYPQTSWRATHPLAEGKSLGGTNFVALSGLGLDSARYDPANPDHAKKVGMVGYDWGSKPADVTDGLSNTIYMIQVPPTHARPWIAGGGSTVQGVDDMAANPVQDFVHTAPGNKRGTYAMMADGSVRFVPESIDPKVFKAMATRAGGETITDLDKHAPLIAGPKTNEGTLTGGVGGPTAQKKPEPKKDVATEGDLDKLQGKWKFKKAYSGREGKEMPAELMNVMQIQVVGNRIIASAAGKEITTGELTLDATKTPKTMLIKTTSLAIPLPDSKVGDEDYSSYELTGDKLVIRSAAKGVKEFPKEVKPPEAGSKDDYQELERVKD